MEAFDPERVSEGLRAHLLDPRGVGVLEGPGARRVTCVNGACGDELELSGRLEHGRLALRFRTGGCWGVVACASLLVDRLDGRPLEEARTLDLAAEVERAGGVPRSRAHAVRLCERALAELLAQLGADRVG